MSGLLGRFDEGIVDGRQPLGLTAERCIGEFDDQIVHVREGVADEYPGVFSIDRWIPGEVAFHVHLRVSPNTVQLRLQACSLGGCLVLDG